jgi:serine/threonine protein kinase
MDRFVRTVLRSGLLHQQELETALRELPGQSDPALLANHLVHTGQLSVFQSRKLLQGRSLGLVLGPYQIMAPIGKGGMGRVYLARDQRGPVLVALKILPPQKAREEDRHLARFLREMELCQRVAHSHLPQIYEVGISQGVYYIAMEFVPGRSLFNIVSEDGPLTVPRAARLFGEVASALEHAHDRGLIHRDLKPSNILITTSDHAKLLDLGLAIIQGEAPSDHTVVGGQGYVVGTMDYLAPEQAEDAAKVDARSDIYSLGCTLYFALTGRQPFPGGTSIKKIRRHLTEEPIPVNSLNPAVPPEFAGLLGRMMAKQPGDRFPGAAELRQALLSWAESNPPPSSKSAEDEAYQRAVAALRSSASYYDFSVGPQISDDVPILGKDAAEERPFNQRPALVTLAVAGIFGSCMALSSLVYYLIR